MEHEAVGALPGAEKRVPAKDAQLREQQQHRDGTTPSYTDCLFSNIPIDATATAVNSWRSLRSRLESRSSVVATHLQQCASKDSDSAGIEEQQQQLIVVSAAGAAPTSLLQTKPSIHGSSAV